MKKIIRIEALSCFSYKTSFKTRTEIEFYSDGTTSVVEAVYYLK